MSGYSKVYWQDDIIRVDYIDDQKKPDIDKSVEESKPMIEKLRNENKKVLFLVWMSDQGGADYPARMAALGAVKNLNYDKMAIFSKTLTNKTLANFIIMASGNASKVQFFNDEETAIHWLRI